MIYPGLSTAVSSLTVTALATIFFLFIPRSNIAAMLKPITKDIKTAHTALAIPISRPRTLAVRTMANRLIAGPEYKNAVAGPIPAPLLYMPANIGSTVQLQTARIVPEMDATL